MKSGTGRQWRELAYHWQELAEHRGTALSNVWLAINAHVHDRALAAELQMSIVGGLLPDLVVGPNDEEDEETEEEA